MLFPFLSILIVWGTDNPLVDQDALFHLVHSAPGASGRVIWMMLHQVPGRRATQRQVENYIIRERRRNPALAPNKPTADEIILNESVLPLSVYQAMKENTFVDTNVLPVTLWRWNRFVIGMNEEPLFTADRVIMTKAQSDRMIANWKIDRADKQSRKLLRDTAWHLVYHGSSSGGSLWNLIRLLGFTATRKQINTVLDHARKLKREVDD